MAKASPQELAMLQRLSASSKKFESQTKFVFRIIPNPDPIENPNPTLSIHKVNGRFFLCAQGKTLIETTIFRGVVTTTIETPSGYEITDPLEIQKLKEEEEQDHLKQLEQREILRRKEEQEHKFQPANQILPQQQQQQISQNIFVTPARVAYSLFSIDNGPPQESFQ